MVQLDSVPKSSDLETGLAHPMAPACSLENWANPAEKYQQKSMDQTAATSVLPCSISLVTKPQFCAAHILNLLNEAVRGKETLEGGALTLPLTSQIQIWWCNQNMYHCFCRLIIVQSCTCIVNTVQL